MSVVVNTGNRDTANYLKDSQGLLALRHALLGHETGVPLPHVTPVAVGVFLDAALLAHSSALPRAVPHQVTLTTVQVM